MNEHLKIFTHIYVTGFKIVKKAYEFLRYGLTSVNQGWFWELKISARSNTLRPQVRKTGLVVERIL